MALSSHAAGVHQRRRAIIDRRGDPHRQTLAVDLVTKERNDRWPFSSPLGRISTRKETSSPVLVAGERRRRNPRRRRWPREWRRRSNPCNPHQGSRSSVTGCRLRCLASEVASTVVSTSEGDIVTVARFLVRRFSREGEGGHVVLPHSIEFEKNPNRTVDYFGEGEGGIRDRDEFWGK